MTPTEKQVKYANDIAKTLGIDLPNIKTKESYWQFISDNVDAYKKEQRYIMADELCMYGIDECDYIGHIPGDI